jgi:hypothetical protein
VPYTSMSCWWILAANTSHAHKTHITPWTSKWDQFSKAVTTRKCHSCPPSVHVPWITRTWTLEPSVAYINSIWNFNESGISNNRTCKPLVIHPCTVQRNNEVTTVDTLAWKSETAILQSCR